MDAKPRLAAFETWSKLFPSQDHATWQEWWDFKNTVMCADFKALLERRDIRIEFRARALTLLILPNYNWCPFYTGKNSGGWQETMNAADLKGLPEPLVAFAADLIVQCIDALNDGRSVPNRPFESLSVAYQEYLHQLLTILPVEKAEAVFERFQLNDFATFSGMEESSGYNPFEKLLRDPAIPHHWKGVADAKMRETILREVRGQSEPRAKWEDAVERYADIVRLSLQEDGRVPYSQELFADQVQFLVGLPVKGKNLVQPHLFSRLILRLVGRKYDELCYRITAAVMLKNRDPFRVYDEETLKTAKHCLMMYGPRDPELKRALERAIELGSRKAENAMSVAAQLRTTEQRIMAKMRAPISTFK